MFRLQRRHMVVAVAALASGCEGSPVGSTAADSDVGVATSEGAAISAAMAAAQPLQAILGRGDPGFFAKFLSSRTIGNSEIYEVDGKVIIGGTAPGARLQVQDDFSGGGPIVNIHQVRPDGDIALDFSDAEAGLLGNVGVVRSDGPERFFVLQNNPRSLALTLAENGGNVGIGLANPATTLDVSGDANISGNLTVGGTKSSVATLADGRRVVLYAIESPQNWFEDFGSSRLDQGEAWVSFEAMFKETVNTAGGYHVFLTPSGECNGLYVAERRPDGFLVRELGQGTSTVSFDYRIVAPRKGFETVRLEQLP